MHIAMDPEDIERLVAKAIRDHEIRVAAVSGVMGAFLIVGTWHAIWLLR